MSCNMKERRVPRPPAALHVFPPPSLIRLLPRGWVNAASGGSGSDDSTTVGTPLGGPGGRLLLDGVRVSAYPCSGVHL